MSRPPGRYRSHRNFVLMKREAQEKAKTKKPVTTPVAGADEMRLRAARVAMLHGADRVERVTRAAGYIPQRSYVVPERGCWARRDDDSVLGRAPTPPSELALRVLIAIYLGCSWRGLIRFDLHLDGTAHMIFDGARAPLGNWRDAPDALDAAVLLVLREQVGRHHEVCGGTDPDTRNGYEANLGGDLKPFPPGSPT